MLLGAVALPAVLALLNVFGQRPATARANTEDATLSVYSPSHLRAGLLYTARFHVTAHAELQHATLVLDPGWQWTLSRELPSPSCSSSC